jgi:hypothetical protein
MQNYSGIKQRVYNSDVCEINNMNSLSNVKINLGFLFFLLLLFLFLLLLYRDILQTEN